MDTETEREAAPRLTDEQLAEALALTREADSVELKLNIPAAEHRATVAALDLDPLEAQIRQVYFFDTVDLDLDRLGVIVRARRSQGRGDDSVVKVRPVVPASVPASVRRSEHMVVELDAMPGGFVCSASMKGKPGRGAARQVASGAASVRTLLSGEQRRFFEAHVTDGPGLDDLVVLGPITVLKLKFTSGGYDLVAELWLNPDGSHSLELSTKADPAIAFQTAAELRAHLVERGVGMTGAQQTKTRSALDRLTAGLRG
jgi:hypothetical protein